MNEERDNERDSQLSAMFDGELPAAECELLARRLTRDEGLRAQWSRYSKIGAALRAERGVALHDRVALRVQSAVAQDAAYGDGGSLDVNPASAGPVQGPAIAARAPTLTNDRWMRFARPLMGASIAAGVATMSIFWLRSQDAGENVLANNPVPATVVLAPETVGATVALNSNENSNENSNDQGARAAEPAGNGEPERYVTPAVAPRSLAPPAHLANYVVAHSEYSGPLARRMSLLGLVAAENAVDNSPLDDATTGTTNPAPAAGASNAP